jgi:hypothetical protein
MSFFDILYNNNYLQFKLKMILLKILSFLIIGPFFKFKPGLQIVEAGPVNTNDFIIIKWK